LRAREGWPSGGGGGGGCRWAWPAARALAGIREWPDSSLWVIWVCRVAGSLHISGDALSGAPTSAAMRLDRFGSRLRGIDFAAARAVAMLALVAARLVTAARPKVARAAAMLAHFARRLRSARILLSIAATNPASSAL
jgi:hypothetical protein